MFRASAILVVAMTISTICVGFSGGAWAQTALTPDTFQVNYFSNANTSGAPDQTVRITNPGQQGDTAAGTLCANIYVFNTKEELDECCSCPITPNGLQAFSVNTNLTSNPLSGPKPTDGVIKIVSGAASSGACPNQGTSVTLLPALRAWSTHTQKTSSSLSGATYSVTEEEFSQATLGNNEFADLQEDCRAALELGTGAGACSCPSFGG